MSRRSSTTTKVFVGSLPTGTTIAELKELFAPYGEIAECDVVNRCGFLHLENRQLAYKAIDELNKSNFKGSIISVEKGRVKPPSRRGGNNGGGGSRNGSGRGSRNGYGSGGPMRGGRDNYRSGPYHRDGGNFDRRGPSRPPMGGGNSYGGGRGNGGFDRGYERQPPSRSMNDSSGGGPDRRPYMDNRRSDYPEPQGYSDGGYGIGPGGDSRMYSEDRGMYGSDRGGSMNSRVPYDRRSMMDPQPMSGVGMGLNNSIGNITMSSMQPSYDRRPPADMYSRRDVPPKPLVGGYNEPVRGMGYDSAYPPLQQRGYSGGPAPRRDMPPGRRF